MLVKEIMTPRVIAVDPETTLKEAARMLYKNKISGAPVIDRAGVLLGVISEKEIFRALFPDHETFYKDPTANNDAREKRMSVDIVRERQVQSFMNQRPVTVSSDEGILHAAALMLSRGMHRLPVLDKNKMIGIVTRKDVYRAVLQIGFDLK